MNKNELARILSDPISKQHLYNAVTLQFDDKSEFNQQDYTRCILRNFWYQMLVAVPEEGKKINEIIGSDGTFESFYSQIMNKGLYNKFYNYLKNSLQTETEWAHFGAGKNETIDGKIYLSVRNEQLYLLADEILKKITQVGMVDYDFKVNCNPEISRRDGIVIYFNRNNFKKYISIIESIKREHPEIDFKEPNCFAYSYNDFIGIGKDYKDGNSFTGKCCDMIGELDLSGTEYSFEDIEKSINEHLKDVIDMCKSLTEEEYSLEE